MLHPERLVVLGLGGNLEGVDVLAERFRNVVERLGRGPLRDLRLAPLYLTSPVLQETEAGHPQPDYLNTVAVGSLAPHLEPGAEAARHLVGWFKRLEAEAGRDADAPQDSPRPLDVDLLLLGTLCVDLPARPDSSDTHGTSDTRGQPPDWPSGWPGAVTVPHPRLRLRRFVLRPLCDLLPDLQLPQESPSRPGVTAQEAPRITVLGALSALDGVAEEQRVEPVDKAKLGPA